MHDAPRLSIALVVHREQGFVRACLGSLLPQSAAAGVELVVVDDDAADHSGEIAGEVLAGVDRAAVHPLRPRCGPGPARRAALDLVTGEHVWFVEPTDLLPDGAVEAVLARLAEASPDVLVVGHDLLDVYGEQQPGPDGPGGLTPQLWDKVARTAVLRDLAAARPGVLGEGAGWEVRTTWPVLHRVDQVAVLPGSAYVRRDLPRRVRARSEVGPRGDVITAYAEVLAALGEGDAALRRAVLTDLAQAGPRLVRELPARSRPQAFRELAAAWTRHADELEGLARLDPAHRKALATGSHRAWLVADEARAAPRRARRLARSAARTVRHPRRLARRARSAPMRAWYRLQLRAPLEKDLVVYAAYWYTACSCNPRAVFEKARELAPWTRGVWVVEAGKVDVVPAGVDHVVAGTREYYRLMARATYLVNNVNFPNDIVKRPGQVHLQTHHGTPLKTMGMDLVHSPHSRKRMNFPRLMKRVARWDYSVSQNSFTSEQWERVYPSGTFESIETGYPRNDVLVTSGPADVARARAELGIAAGETAVLYLPTHREYHPGYVPQLDPDRLAAALGPDHVLLMRAHYFYRDKAGAEVTAASPQVRDVAGHPRIEDLYLAADVLVTDYSSAMFDYAVLDRPVVIYAPDWDDYRRLRGTTFDLMAEPPGAVATTEAELTEVLVSRRAWDDDSAARRRAFRDRFCSLEDGKASDRVVRILWPAPSGGHP